MPYQIQFHLVSAVASTMIYAAFFALMVGPIEQADQRAEILLRLWATGFLALVVAYIVVMVVVYVVFSILRSIALREIETPVADELGRLIGLKGAQNGGVATSMALVASMAVMATGMGVTPMFITLIGGLYIAGLVSDFTEIYYYRRGF